MKPDKALDLVLRFSALTYAIKAMAYRIGDELEKCQGLKGFRNEMEECSYLDGSKYRVPSERSNTDSETHLKGWYTPEVVYDYDGHGTREYLEVGEDERAECPHCFAAHLLVQDRKTLRRQLGAVKAAMTRTSPKPAILTRALDLENVG